MSDTNKLMTAPIWKAVLIAPLALLVLVIETVGWGCDKAAEKLADGINRFLGQREP